MEVEAFNAQRYGFRVAEKPAASAALNVTEKSACAKKSPSATLRRPRKP